MPPSLQRGHAVVMLFLVTACVLAFEVAVSRVCAVLLQYHISFAVVSLAILGLGLGGFAAYLLTRGRPERVPAVAAAAVLALGPAMLLAVASLLALPFAENWPFLLFLLLPAFVAAGAFQALVLREFSDHAGALYAADLAGGATGAMASVPLLNALQGPVNTTLALSLVAACAAWWWSARAARARGPARLGAALAAAALGAAALQGASGFLDVDYRLAPHKLLSKALRPKATVVSQLLPELQRWDAYSRVDVLEIRSSLGVQRSVFIDGETPTAMLAPDGRAPGHRALEIRATLPALPYRLLRPESVVSIGSGGGYDVVLARRFDARRIDAVELNAGVLEVVDEAREFTGDVYRQDGVAVFHADGRLFVRTAAPGSYDLVALVLAQSLAGNLREYALSENYLYTREAVADYLRPLRPGGAISISIHNRTLVRRLLGTALEVLAEQGLPARDCVVALFSGKDSPYDHLLLVRSEPFDAHQRQALAWEIRTHGYTPLHVPDGVVPAAAPAVPIPPDPRLRLAPATDDRPFFFHVFGETPRGLVILVATAAGLLAVALLGMGWAARARATAQGLGQAGYFVLLGLAFMMVEVLVLQKTVLVTAYPTLNLAVILATFLLAAGLGSAASAPLMRRNARRRLRLLLAGLGLALLGLVPLLDALRTWLDPLPLAARCLGLSAALFPFAFAMGMPFPLGIRLLPRPAVDLVPWFWGLNGVASILGSGLVVAIVLEAGFLRSFLLPAVLYLLAVAFTRDFAGQLRGPEGAP